MRPRVEELLCNSSPAEGLTTLCTPGALVIRRVSPEDFPGTHKNVTRYFPFTPYVMAPCGQVSEQLAQRMQSACSISPARTMPFTSRPIGHSREHVLQSVHFVT